MFFTPILAHILSHVGGQLTLPAFLVNKPVIINFANDPYDFCISNGRHLTEIICLVETSTRHRI
jgi:hypothetical protein